MGPYDKEVYGQLPILLQRQGNKGRSLQNDVA